jgi:dihydrodipicolinate synthase/N-acetylneuraminate lyase
LTAARIVLEDFSPFPPVLKVILAHKHNFPNWIVRPPLLSLTPAEAEKAVAEIDAVL